MDMSRRFFCLCGIVLAGTILHSRAVGAQVTAPPPTHAKETPIVGFLDTHLHQFSNLGMGGLVVWGSPMDPLLDPSASDEEARARALPSGDYLFVDSAGLANIRAAADLNPVATGDAVECVENCSPRCPPGTGVVGNPCWLVFVHGATGTKDLINQLAGSFPPDHGVSGYPLMGAPDPHGWPAWDILTMQQAYWEWLKRAHDHGLQMITMVALNNRVFCGMRVHYASYECLQPTADDRAVERQIQAAKDLEAYIDARSGGAGLGFYRIVLSAEEARAAIKNGQMAVVLGAEVDHPWGCTVDASGCGADQIRAGVQAWYDMGIRVMYPVHVTDNKFGGAAAYTGIFDFANALLNTTSSLAFLDLTDSCPVTDASPLPDTTIGGPALEWRAVIRDVMTDVETGVDVAIVAMLALGPLFASLIPAFMLAIAPLLAAVPLLTPLLPALAPVLGLVGALPFVAGALILFVPPLLDVVPPAPGARPAANCNARSLTTEGEVLINALMDHKMIIDIDHVDLRTFGQILDIAETRHYSGIVSGHTSLMGAGLTAIERPVLFPTLEDFDIDHTTRNEFNKSDAMVKRILAVGGTVSLVPREGGRDRIRDFDPADDVQFDCGQSSQAFAQVYLYAIRHLGMDAVGLGSDMNGFVSQPAPRYGDEACGEQLGHSEGGHPGDYPLLPPYDRNRQEGRIVYDDNLTDYFGNDLGQYTFGERTWDFNVDGLAHVGLYPDFVADLRAIGLSEDELAPLFNSVEAYVFMWERVDDEDPPTVACGTVGTAWNPTNVTVTCSAWDDGTGLANHAADASFTLTTTVADGAVDGNASTGTHDPICDRDGNCTEIVPAITGVKVDRQNPSILVSAPTATTYLINQVVTASYSCSDGTGSGIASCTGTAPSGTAIATTVGNHAFVVNAADNVGHTASATVNYAVSYNVCLLYDPTKAQGGTVPIRLRLCDAGSVNLSTGSLAVTATRLDSSPPPPNFVGRSNLGFAFRYDSTILGYVYNVDTKALSSGLHTMTFVVAGDPVAHTATFMVK